MASKERENVSDAPDSSPSSDSGDTNSSPALPTPIAWVQRQMFTGVRALDVLRGLLGQNWTPPENTGEMELWELVLELVTRPPPRALLPSVTTLDDAVQLIKNSKNILILSGAGISVSCGIPDFRSTNGLYARLAQEFPELPDPQAMFDIHFFEDDPRPFFRFAKEIMPGTYQPSVCHRLVAALEKRGKLLRNYTQNIDTLEQVAGITRVEYCHGSFATASCRLCNYTVAIDNIKSDIMKEEVPLCPRCIAIGHEGVMKPNIVFFGEGLKDTFHKSIQEDKEKADLLVVVGSSLKVRPVSLLPDMLPNHIPQILINKEPLPHVKGFDVRLLGLCDEIATEICRQLGDDWLHDIGVTAPVESLTSTQPRSRVYLFNGGIWTEERQEPVVEEEDDSREEEKDKDDIIKEEKEKEDSKGDKYIREEEKEDIRENGTVDRKDTEGCRQDVVVEKRSVEHASTVPTHSDSQHSDLVLPTAKRKKLD